MENLISVFLFHLFTKLNSPQFRNGRVRFYHLGISLFSYHVEIAFIFYVFFKKSFFGAEETLFWKGILIYFSFWGFSSIYIIAHFKCPVSLCPACFVLLIIATLFAGLTYLPTLAILFFISIFEIWGYALLDNCIIHVDMPVSDGFSEEIKTIGTCQCYCIITYLPLSPYLYSINILL